MKVKQKKMTNKNEPRPMVVLTMDFILSGVQLVFVLNLFKMNHNL